MTSPGWALLRRYAQMALDVGGPSYWARPWVRCTVLPLAANTVCSARNPSPFTDVTLTPCTPAALGKLRPTSSVACPCGGSVTCCCTVRPALPYSVATTRTVAADGL